METQKSNMAEKIIRFRSIKNFKKNIFDEDQSLEDIIPFINKTKNKLILVTKNNKLNGVISLGNIIHGISKYKTIKLKLKKISNKKFYYLSELSLKKINSHNLIHKKFNYKNFFYIPILKKNKIIRLIKVYKKYDNKNIPIVIMAGGKGKRLMPLTRNLPKPLLEVNGEPMIYRLLKKIVTYNFQNYYISVNYLKEKIISYFNKKELNFGIKFLIEQRYLGTAGILHLFKKKPYENILVINCDIDTDLNFDNLINFHQKNKSDFTIVTKHLIKKSDFGIVRSKNKKVYEIIEKKNEEIFINSGIYIINRKCLNYLNNNYMDMTSLISMLIKKKFRVIEYPSIDYWSDLGDKKRFHKL